MQTYTYVVPSIIKYRITLSGLYSRAQHTHSLNVTFTMVMLFEHILYSICMPSSVTGTLRLVTHSRYGSDI